MLQLIAVDGQSVQTVTANRFPFSIGRAPSAGLRLDSLGVWDRHATITLRNGRFHIAPEGESLLLINDQRSDGAILRTGDELSVGAARISVTLSPALQSGLRSRETFVWLALGAVTLAQVLLLLGLD